MKHHDQLFPALTSLVGPILTIHVKKIIIFPTNLVSRTALYPHVNKRITGAGSSTPDTILHVPLYKRRIDLVITLDINSASTPSSAQPSGAAP
jgi:hypothetical protein